MEALFANILPFRWSPLLTFKNTTSKVARLSIGPLFKISLSRDYFNVVKQESSQLCFIHHHLWGIIRKVLTQGIPKLLCLGGFQLGA